MKVNFKRTRENILHYFEDKTNLKDYKFDIYLLLSSCVSESEELNMIYAVYSKYFGDNKKYLEAHLQKNYDALDIFANSILSDFSRNAKYRNFVKEFAGLPID